MKKNSGKLTKILMGGVGLGLLSSNLASAGHGVSLPGIMQYNGEGGKLYNQPENIYFGDGPGNHKTGEKYNIKLSTKNMLNSFGLSPIGDFYRGEKKFISDGNDPRLEDREAFHYSNYGLKQQEAPYIGREWTYGIWEGTGGVYNLYDPKGDKWGECVPYHITGSNRVLRNHAGNDFDYNEDRNVYFDNSDEETRNILSLIYSQTTRRKFSTNSYAPYKLSKTEKKFFSPIFIGKYNRDYLGIQFHVPYVIDEQGIKQKDINLISNAGHLNGILDPADVKFDFTFY